MLVNFENIENFVYGIRLTNPDSVAWGINYLLDSPMAIKQISENCGKSVIKFGWANVTRQYLKVYWLGLDKQDAEKFKESYSDRLQSELKGNLFNDRLSASKPNLHVTPSEPLT
jgi:hypothetical protein